MAHSTAAQRAPLAISDTAAQTPAVAAFISSAGDLSGPPLRRSSVTALSEQASSFHPTSSSFVYSTYSPLSPLAPFNNQYSNGNYAPPYGPYGNMSNFSFHSPGAFVPNAPSMNGNINANNSNSNSSNSGIATSAFANKMMMNNNNNSGMYHDGSFPRNNDGVSIMQFPQPRRSSFSYKRNSRDGPTMNLSFNGFPYLNSSGMSADDVFSHGMSVAYPSMQHSGASAMSTGINNNSAGITTGVNSISSHTSHSNHSNHSNSSNHSSNASVTTTSSNISNNNGNHNHSSSSSSSSSNNNNINNSSSNNNNNSNNGVQYPSSDVQGSNPAAHEQPISTHNFAGTHSSMKGHTGGGSIAVPGGSGHLMGVNSGTHGSNNSSAPPGQSVSSNPGSKEDAPPLTPGGTMLPPVRIDSLSVPGNLPHLSPPNSAGGNHPVTSGGSTHPNSSSASSGNHMHVSTPVTPSPAALLSHFMHPSVGVPYNLAPFNSMSAGGYEQLMGFQGLGMQMPISPAIGMGSTGSFPQQSGVMQPQAPLTNAPTSWSLPPIPGLMRFTMLSRTGRTDFHVWLNATSEVTPEDSEWYKTSVYTLLLRLEILPMFTGQYYGDFSACIELLDMDGEVVKDGILHHISSDLPAHGNSGSSGSAKPNSSRLPSGMQYKNRSQASLLNAAIGAIFEQERADRVNDRMEASRKEPTGTPITSKQSLADGPGQKDRLSDDSTSSDHESPVGSGRQNGESGTTSTDRDIPYIIKMRESMCWQGKVGPFSLQRYSFVHNGKHAPFRLKVTLTAPSAGSSSGGAASSWVTMSPPFLVKSKKPKHVVSNHLSLRERKRGRADVHEAQIDAAFERAAFSTR
eukprot:ANDGO_02172.mRNA.1 hypothetical protein